MSGLRNGHGDFEGGIGFATPWTLCIARVVLRGHEVTAMGQWLWWTTGARENGGIRATVNGGTSTVNGHRETSNGHRLCWAAGTPVYSTYSTLDSTQYALRRR